MGKMLSSHRMGDHVSGTSTVKSSGEPISKVIERDNALIGGMSSFPFLFKVLSVTKPLSIQIHPNKVIFTSDIQLIRVFTISLIGTCVPVETSRTIACI